MVAVPAPAPETMPDEEPTVATPVALLLHVPPVGLQLSVVVDPSHTVVVPVMDPGAVVTVTSRVVKQPPLSV